MQIRRPHYVSLKLSDDENEKLNKLMERHDKTRSELIRYALKNLYLETMNIN